MKYIIDADTSRCTGCGACAVACMDQNDTSISDGEAPLRKTFTVEKGVGKTLKMAFISIACMHCTDAPCIPACPVGCIKRDEATGFVVYDNTCCIGCHSCSLACPFAAPSFTREGKMVKCDGCAVRVAYGMLPACVRACPFDALSLVTENEYEKNRTGKSLHSIADRILADEVRL